MNQINEQKRRKRRSSILDSYIQEISEYRKIGLNSIAIFKLLKVKIENKICYDAVLRFIKRNKL